MHTNYHIYFARIYNCSVLLTSYDVLFSFHIFSILFFIFLIVSIMFLIACWSIFMMSVLKSLPNTSDICVISVLKSAVGWFFSFKGNFYFWFMWLGVTFYYNMDIWRLLILFCLGVSAVLSDATQCEPTVMFLLGGNWFNIFHWDCHSKSCKDTTHYYWLGEISSHWISLIYT